ncbi:MAG: acylphosphatase [Myxococcota bacterium]
MTDAAAPRRVRVRVEGRVQGVAFRAHTADAARAAAVAGWVRNRTDGSVEACLEGAPDAVERVVAAMRAGPRFARVRTLEIWDEASEGDRFFEIRR